MRLNQWLLRLSRYGYRLLLFGYPTSFRRMYGRQMAQLFADCCRAAWANQGIVGLLIVWWQILGDWGQSVPRENFAAFRSVTNLVKFKVRSQLFMERRYVVMSNYHPFTEQLATVLEKEPIYYRLLTSPQPTRRMNEVVESLALEGDPETPEMTLALFQSLGGDVPEVHLDRWLDRFREVAQRLYGDVLPEDKAEVTSKLLQAIYAEPRLYELVANVEPGYGLLEIVESLALEADETNLAQMLDLMFRLALE